MAIIGKLLNKEQYMDLIRNEDGHYYGSAEEMERQKIINQKVSEAKKGKPTWSKGKTFSEEMKHNMSLAHRKNPVKCVELDMIFDSGKSAAEYLQLNKRAGSFILKCAREGKPCYGYNWEIIKGE